MLNWFKGRKARSSTVVVHTMGKVGSSSIYETLRQNYPEFSVFHSHVIGNVDAMAEQIAMDPDDPLRTPRQHYIDTGRKLLGIMNSGECLNVISLTRDPVARSISALFQNLEFLIPNFIQKLQAGEIGWRDLEKLLFAGVGGCGNPRDWFDKEFSVPFGIDVYEAPFPVEKGFQVFSGRRARALVIRLENLNVVGAKAIGRFLGISGFQLQKHNNASRKEYHSIYQDFKSNVQLPASYLYEMYESRYCRHFYSQAEREKFRRFWSNSRQALRHAE